jgi:hypothetical protein
MFFKSTNADRHATTELIANNSRSNRRYTSLGDLTSSPLDLSPFPDPRLSQAMETEREEASRHLAILANSIFASVGC